jgi:hypothetical protein
MVTETDAVHCSTDPSIFQYQSQFVHDDVYKVKFFFRDAINTGNVQNIKVLVTTPRGVEQLSVGLK